MNIMDLRDHLASSAIYFAFLHFTFLLFSDMLSA